MTDRSKSKVFKFIDLYTIRDIDTGLTIQADRLIEKYIRLAAPAGQVIQATASTVELGNVLESKEITLHPDQSIEVKYEDFYDLSCIITANSNNQDVLLVWVETTDDDGATWTPFPLSGRRQSFSNKNEGDVEFSTKLTLAAGTRFRFRAKAEASTITLGGLDINTGTGIVGVPAVTCSIARI